MALTGFLTRTISRIRLFTGEPSVNAKYSDAELIDLIESAWGVVIADELLRVSDHPVCAEATLSVAANTQKYILPPTMSEILMIGEQDSTTKLFTSDHVPRSRFNPSGPGWALNGNVLEFTPLPTNTVTLVIAYIPGGDVRLHHGTAQAAAAGTITLATSPTVGAIDERPNAYVGCMVRLLDSSGGSATPLAIGEERIITAYNKSTKVATVSPNWTTTPAGTLTYEVAPLLSSMADMVVACYVAQLIVGLEGNARRQATMEKEFQRMMRGLRLKVGKLEMRRGTRFQHDTASNPLYLASAYILRG